jgi:hypothetical protein
MHNQHVCSSLLLFIIDGHICLLKLAGYHRSANQIAGIIQHRMKIHSYRKYCQAAG